MPERPTPTRAAPGHLRAALGRLRAAVQREHAAAEFRVLAVLGLFALTLANLAGCSRVVPAEAIFTDYVAALSALAGAPAAESTADRIESTADRIEALPLPRTRERRFDLPRHDVGMGDWFRLRHCGLGALVSQRNSALGRVMADSVRWVYERRFLAAADACPLPPELAPRIAPLIAAKRAELPRHRWNAFWAGPEVARLAGFSDGPPPAKGAAASTAATLAALEQITAALAAPSTAAEGAPAPEADPRPSLSLDAALGQLSPEALVGRSILGFVIAINGLNDANRALEALSALGAPDACPADRAAVAGVFRDHYAARVQPWLVRLKADGAPVLVALHRLYRVGAAGVEPTPAMAAFAAQLDPGAPSALVPATRAALQRHIERWRPLLVRCQLSVADLAAVAQPDP